MKMLARTLSLGALPRHALRAANSASHAVSSQALSVAQVYQARVSSGQEMASVSVIKRSQFDSSEHASQYAVARGSIGGGPEEELHAIVNAITPTPRLRTMKPSSNMVRETNLGSRNLLHPWLRTDTEAPPSLQGCFPTDAFTEFG